MGQRVSPHRTYATTLVRAWLQAGRRPGRTTSAAGGVALAGRAGRSLLLVMALILAATLGTPPDLARGAPDHQPAPGTFLDTFTGRPPAPTPWRGSGWDVTVHSRNREAWDTLEPMAAHHGPDCAAPPAVHPTSAYDDAVYQCNDHVMTSINASGYGVIYLTPNQQLDFKDGEAVLRFDLSTLRTSMRDWVDIWVTPYNEHLQLPLESWLPDLTGEPRRAVHIRLDTFNNESVFKGTIYRDTVEESVQSQSLTGYEKVLTPSAVRRDPFELRISRTSIKFGMPDYNLWWIDSPIADLGWDRAIVQFGHHSYTPTKDCGRVPCAANTWHWDSVSIAPAVPFTIVPGDARWLNDERGNAVQFAAPAPPESHLRFVAIGTAMEVSFDGGASWQQAQPQPIRQGRDVLNTFVSYWTPMPTGATSVVVRGGNWLVGAWQARDFAIWSLTPPAATNAAAPASDAPEE